MGDADQRACDECGKLGGYRIANTDLEHPENGNLYVAKSPPWYRDAVNPRTNRPTGALECGYRGGALCRECAEIKLKRLLKERAKKRG